MTLLTLFKTKRQGDQICCLMQNALLLYIACYVAMGSDVRLCFINIMIHLYLIELSITIWFTLVSLPQVESALSHRVLQMLAKDMTVDQQ